MPQHVRMNLERKLSRYACALDHSQEPCWRYWRASLGNEHIRALSLQWSQCPKLRTMQRMHTFNSALSPIHMQSAAELGSRRSVRFTIVGDASVIAELAFHYRGC